MDFTARSESDDQYLHLQQQKLIKREPMSSMSNSTENDFLEFVTSPLKISYSSSFTDTNVSDWITDFWEDDFLYLNEFVSTDDSTSQVTTAGTKSDQKNLDVCAKTDQVTEAEKKKKTKGMGRGDGFRKKQRKSYSKSGNTSTLNVDEIQKYFDMPISMAAKKMNVGLTVLKKRCRELKIMRWPHRKIMSLKSLINNVKELGMDKEVEKLEDHKTIVERMPQVELTERMKKLRQACFKAKYKKKKQMRACGGGVGVVGSLHLIK